MCRRCGHLDGLWSHRDGMKSEEGVERQGPGFGGLIAFGGRTRRGVGEGQPERWEALRASVVL